MTNANVNVSTTKSTTTVTETQTGIVVATDGLFGPRSVVAPLSLDANANLGLDFNAPLVNSGGNLALDMGPFRDSKRVYVSADAKALDTNNGTSPLEPVATIKKAAEIATPGMLIEVGPGVYSEQLPIRVPRDVGILAQGLRNVRIQPASGYEFNNIFQVDSGFWIWGMELAGHQADLANGLQSWAISFDHLADNTAAPLNASGLGAYILKSPYIQNCSSITAEDDSGTAGSVSVGDTGGGIEVDGDKCAPNSPIRSMVVDSYTQVNLGGPGCHVLNDGYAQLVSFFGTFCTFHCKTTTGGQANLSGGGTTDFGDQGLVADGFSKVPNFKGSARVQAFGADRIEKNITFDVAGDLCNSGTNHGLSANDQITFKATDGTLPQGVDTGAIFYVIASGLTATAFKVATTQAGTAVNITGSAAGTYQILRQGSLVCDVVSLTANRVGSQSRPNPGQLMFPRVNFPSAGESGSAGNAVSVSAVNGSTATTTIAANGIDHWFAEGGTATIGGTAYSIASAVYDNATGSLEFTATGYTPQIGDSVTFADLSFFCPNTGRYVITGSVPIDASGNTVAADAANLAGYRLNFYNEINGGLRNTLEANQVVDFRLRSQISCALHTMEYVGSGTNYDALPWNGGVPNPSKERIELNGGRVFGATINELGDFEIADGVFEIDGTTGSATINTDEFNISGLNFIGPFSRNGGFSTVGVQLREVSDNTSLISSTGAPDGNTVPTQDAVKNYVDTTTVQSVDLSAPTGFTSSGGPVTGSGTLDLAFDTGYQGFLTAESTKLAGIETAATQDQSGAEIKALYEAQPDTNEFSDAEQSKLAGIEAGATQDQTGAEIKALYESQPDTNEFSDSEQSKLLGIEANATQDQSSSEIKTLYESNSDTNNFSDAAQTKLAGIEAGAQVNIPTNLVYTSGTREIASSTGANAVIPEVVASGDSGLITGADKAKVDGIENNATADQSAAEIRSAYLSNSDTNNFSDAAQTKLSGIEANATQDQSAVEIRDSYESNSDRNAYTDAEKTKLSGIATGAQANVATNLSYASNTRTVSSSTGSDTTLPLAVASGDAGLLTGSDKTQLDNLSTNLAGKANLSGGKLAASELPDLAITEFKGSVTNQTAMLAITGERGDWVTRSDDGKVYVITGTDPSQASDWTALSYPASDVLSVNGLSGAVVLNADNISDTGTTNKYTTTAEITKLLGIESGATQDQSASEIKASFLSNSDTNNFNDAAQTKLAGIATGAQVNIATDLAYDSSTRTVSSSTGTNATIDEVVASGDSGLITGADKAKLDGIESGATQDQTAAEILTAVKTVDGSGSGLDADLLDSVEASSFLRSDTADSFSGALSGTAPISWSGTLATFDAPGSPGTDTATDVSLGLGTGQRIVGHDNGYIRTLLKWVTGGDITIGQGGTSMFTGINFLAGSSGEVKVSGNKIWHVGNDGSGSGLDADLLDGQEGSYYLDYGNFSNTPTIPTNNNQLTNGAGFITSTLTNEQVQDIAGGMVTGNTETGITVTYQDSDGTIDFAVASQTDENFTTTLKNKLDGVASGAEVNVNADWNSSSGDSQILNKPTIPAAYTDSSVDTHLNTSSASSNEVLSWTGTDYDWVAQSGGGGSATQITVADESSDTTCFPVFVTDGGTVPPKVDFGSLQYNSSTGNLTATSFTGSASGLTGIQLTTADETSDTTCFPVFVTNGGAQDPKVDFSNFQYNSSTGNLTATKFTGDGSGLTNLPGGGGGTTDLTYTAGTRVIASSTGTDATLPLMSSGNAGLVPASGGGSTNFLRADGTFAAIAASNPVALKLPIATSATLPTSSTEAQVSSIFGGTAVFNSSNSASWAFDASSITVPEDGIYCVSINVQVTSTGGRAQNLFGFAVGGTAQQGRSSHSYVRNQNSINEAGCTLTELLDLDAGDVLTVIGRSEGSITTSRSTSSTPGSIEIHKVSNTQGPQGIQGEPGVSNIPQNSQTSAYTLVASDNGKHINTTTGGVTVPNGVFSAGDVVSIFNDSTSDQTITQGASVTLRLAGSATTGNRTLGQYGLATLLCVGGSNEFVISGAGLT